MRRTLLIFSILLLSSFHLAAQEFIEHTVKWYEDAQTICNRYGVDMNELLTANSLRFASDIKPKMKIVIPQKQQPKKRTLAPGKEEKKRDEEGIKKGETDHITAADTVSVGVDTVRTTAVDTTTNSTPFTLFKKSLKAGLALPLKSTKGGSDNYMDFYGGALLALEECSKENGLEVDLTVLDIQEDSTYSTLSNCDFVIGPVGEKDLQDVLSAVSDSTWVVSPLDPRSENLAQSHPNFIQAPTPIIRQWENSINWLKRDYITSDKLVVLYEEGGTKPADSTHINRLIDSCGIDALRLGYTLLVGREVADSLIEKFTMAPDAVNRVLIFSDSQSFVNDAVRNLRVLAHNGCKVVLYGPSRIKSFDTIEVENLHTLSFRMSSTYHVNYDAKDVQNFLLKYRAIYNTEPTAFSFQGYDLMKYMLLMTSGNLQQNTEKRLDLLQESFLLKKQGKGWVNSAIREVGYNSEYNISIY